jgi:hypothetical protein
MHYGGMDQLHPEKEPLKYGLTFKVPCFHHHHSFFHTNRRRLNGFSLIINVLLPWLVFILVFGIMSFEIHYRRPDLCYALIALIFLLTVGVFAALAQLARVRKHKETDEEHEPMYYSFLMACCFLAIVGGIFLGEMNYGSRMKWFYDLSSLGIFRDINPAHVVGEQLVDAGQVTFQNDTYLDVTHSMGFKDNDMYCVAPIASPQSSKDTYWDLWVVGKNCCSAAGADYHCKGYSDKINMGAMRMFDADDRPFFRLAVQQAEATYGISTHKPLFFFWEWDPLHQTQELQRIAHRFFYYSIFLALVVQVVLTTIAALAYGREIPVRHGLLDHSHKHHLLNL